MMMKMSELTEKRKEKKKRILRPKMRKRRKDTRVFTAWSCLYTYGKKKKYRNANKEN